MNVPQNVAELQREKVVMELEGIDRMYLNAYVPQLTTAAGIAGFVRKHLGYRFASTKQVCEMTGRFVDNMRASCAQGSQSYTITAPPKPMQ